MQQAVQKVGIHTFTLQVPVLVQSLELGHPLLAVLVIQDFLVLGGSGRVLVGAILEGHVSACHKKWEGR